MLIIIVYTISKSFTGSHTATGLVSDDFNSTYYFYLQHNQPDQSDPTTFHASLASYKPTLQTVFRGNWNVKPQSDITFYEGNLSSAKSFLLTSFKAGCLL